MAQSESRQCHGRPEMRVLGPALAGVLALSAQTGAHADPPGPGVVRGAGNSSGWHAAPGDAGQWKHGWTSPHWRPNRQNGGWGPYGGPPVPTYWVWAQAAAPSIIRSPIGAAQQADGAIPSLEARALHHLAPIRWWAAMSCVMVSFTPLR